MFTQKDISSIDTSYFFILQSSAFSITLQSKNTKHYWHIIHEVGPGYATCQINHKHHYENPWHKHRNQPNLSAVLKEIQSHDLFHLQRKSCKKLM